MISSEIYCLIFLVEFSTCEVLFLGSDCCVCIYIYIEVYIRIGYNNDIRLESIHL